MNTTERATLPDAPHADDELAGVIRVPIATLRYWRHLGTGPRSFRIGRSVRYWRTEVLHWLEQKSTDPHATR